MFYSTYISAKEPRQVILGKYHVKVRSGNRLKEVEKSDDGFYIPSLENLQQRLDDVSILEEVNKCNINTVLKMFGRLAVSMAG